MSTITKEFTKEQLQQIEAAAKEVMWPVVWSEKKAREHFSEKITPKVVLELASIALASLEAEPVAYMWDSDRKDVDAAGYYRPEHKIFAESSVKRYGGKVVALYAAPPAPMEAEPVAVTDDMAYAFHHALSDSSLGADEVEEIKAGLRAAFANVTTPTAPVVPNEKDTLEIFNKWWLSKPRKFTICDSDLQKELQWEAWQDCRAAMLQGADGNSPVIPDGWVACSERMPSIGVPVITCCGDVVQYAAYAWDGKEWQDWYEEYDKLPASTFTHWHPRPAAPQQEVN